MAATAPTATFTDANGVDYNAFGMAPVTGGLKGTHTLERIRGSCYAYFLASGQVPASAMLWHCIQIVELVNDVLVLNATTCMTLDQGNMDSARIVHSAMYPSILIEDAAVDFQLQGSMRSDGLPSGNVDVKVRRRIDFSQYALVNILAMPQIAARVRVALHLRGLFRASGAL